MTRQELCAALDAQLAAAQEQVCVLAVPLAGGVPLYERGAGRRAVSASTIKVFILLAALDEVRRHYCWYLKGVKYANYYKDQINHMETLEDLYRVTAGIKRDLSD